ncbi:MAG: BlaI/MecI/CopY family transcriptional regulator [Planctomycetaceae bacterium]|nr:BlaI/MecI/CopY family transcriptional regulator [Planctomycetaceae bacterium]
MPPHSQDATGAELSILQVLWDDGPTSVRTLTDVLYPGGSKVHYATVKKLLERLESKGYVQRDRSESSHLFQAAIAREDLIGERLRLMAEKLCDGSLAPLLMHLVKSQRLTKSERQSLRSLIDDIDGRPK